MTCEGVSSFKLDHLLTGWWFQHTWNMLVQIGSFPQVGVKIKIWNQQLFLTSRFRHGRTHLKPPRNSFTSRVRKNSTPAFNNAQPKHNVALKITIPKKGQHLLGGCCTNKNSRWFWGTKPCSMAINFNIHPLHFDTFSVRVFEFEKWNSKRSCRFRLKTHKISAAKQIWVPIDSGTWCLLV